MKTNEDARTETAEIYEPFTFRDGSGDASGLGRRVRLAAVTYTWTHGEFSNRRAVSVRELGAKAPTL